MHRHILHVVEEVSQRHKVDGAARLENRLHHVAHLVVHCVTCTKGHNADAVTKYSFDTISCTRCRLSPQKPYEKINSTIVVFTNSADLAPYDMPKEWLFGRIFTASLTTKRKSRQIKNHNGVNHIIIIIITVMLIMIMTMKQNSQKFDKCTHPRWYRCNKSVDLRTGITYDVHGTKRKKCDELQAGQRTSR